MFIKEQTTLLKSDSYRLGYTVIMYYIMLYIIPLIVLVLLNALLIKHVRIATEQRKILMGKPMLLRKSVGIMPLGSLFSMLSEINLVSCLKLIILTCA